MGKLESNHDYVKCERKLLIHSQTLAVLLWSFAMDNLLISRFTENVITYLFWYLSETVKADLGVLHSTANTITPLSSPNCQGASDLPFNSVMVANSFEKLRFSHRRKQTIKSSQRKHPVTCNEGLTLLGSKYWSETEWCERAWECCSGDCLSVLPCAWRALGKIMYCKMCIPNIFV